MKITFLGTGTSQGVPVIACRCKVCQSQDYRDQRLRTSIKIEIDNKVLVVDSGPDFRQQMLRSATQRLDALLFTHEHKDHIAGMDDIRAFNFISKKAVNIYATDRVQNALKREFAYVFSDEKYPGIPEVSLHTISKHASFLVEDIAIEPIEVFHYYLPVLGFKIGDFTYITDANRIEAAELAKLEGTKVLVLNALRKESHISHFTLDEAIALGQKIGAKQTYFTHLSHQMGLHQEVNSELPDGFSIAYDGLEIFV
jgi:phosphoribosyl 1,2-cyclic phosphate phosphodiesterase